MSVVAVLGLRLLMKNHVLLLPSIETSNHWKPSLCSKGLSRYSWFFICVFRLRATKCFTRWRKSLCQSTPKENHGNSLTMHSDMAQHLLPSNEEKVILDPIESSGSYFLSRENAITQTSSLFCTMIFNYLAFMSLVQLLTSRIIPLLFCWLGRETAECTTGSAGSFCLGLSRSLSQCVNSPASVKMGDGIALVLQLGNLNIKWLVNIYTGRLGQSMHPISWNL